MRIISIVLLAVLMSTPAQALSSGVSFDYLSAPAKKFVGKRKSPRQSGGSSVSTKCLKPELQRLLETISSKFGPIKIVSTCRPGATIHGTNRPSLHRYGMAVDFTIALKAQVVSWLRANWHGGVMTYRYKNHIHVDTGRRFYAVGNY